jgi:hypothetical protein
MSESLAHGLFRAIDLLGSKVGLLDEEVDQLIQRQIAANLAVALAFLQHRSHHAHRCLVYEWYPPIDSVDELRAGGAYQIVTPEECIPIACELDATGHLILHPLFGGTEPKHAWASLRLIETEVLPYIEVAEHETTDLRL